MNPHTTLEALARLLALFRVTRRAAGRRPAQEKPLSAGAVASARPLLESEYGAYRRWEQDRALPSDDRWGDAFDGGYARNWRAIASACA